MPDEEIKSPLPPRRYTSIVEDDVTADGPKVSTTAIEPVKTEVPPEGVLMTDQPVKPAAKSKVRLILGIIIGILVLFLIFYFFIKPKIGNNRSQPITINYWGLWEEPAVIEGIIADYESKNPGVKINYVRNQITNYRSRLQARLETDTGSGDAPDIFRIHASWIPMFIDDLAKVPAATATSIGLDSDYFETYKNEIKSGSSWMAVPLMYDGLSLFYNKDLVDSAQVALPKSWWDLGPAAQKITVKDGNGKITIAGAALGLTDNVDQWSDILGLMLKQGNVDILSNDAAEIKKLEDTLTFYTLFKTQYQVWDETLPNSTQLFANGKLGFYFGPSWRVFNIEDTKIPGLKYGITTVPQLPTLDNAAATQANNDANLTNVHWSSYWVEGVNPKSKNQVEAWKFVDFLSTKENLEKFYTAASQIRSFGEIYPRKSMADSMKSNEKTQPFVSVADNAIGWYLSSRTFDDGLNDTMIKYFGDAINSMVFKNIPVDKAMPNLKNGINQLVQKYGLK